jgi:small subunit ribosomal protein S2
MFKFTMATEKKKAAKKAVKKKVAKKTETASAKSKLEELKAKAKALEGKVDEEKKIDIKGEVTGKKEEKDDGLVPIEDYLKSSIHLGIRVITPDMRKYVYRRRADGLAVFDTAMLDDKIKEGAEFLAKYAPEDIVVICKREAGWKAVKKFAETLGIKIFTKKYPAGTLTNPNLEDFFEKELVFICDPWLDKNALRDSNKIKIPVISLCDTNNYTRGIEQVIPGNNKSSKSLGIIFYLLTKLYIENRKLDIEAPSLEEFVDDWENLVPPK